MRRGSLLIAIVFLCGCFQLSKPAPSEHDYRLDYRPPTLSGELLPVVIRVAPVRVAALFDRPTMVYTDSRHQVGLYYYHRWAAPPGEMVADLLVRDLATSAQYRAVQQGPSVLVPDYQIDPAIDRIEEQFADGTCRALLTLRVQVERLRPGTGDPVVLRHVYDESEPVPCNQPTALAAALSADLERISRQLQTDLYTSIAQDL